MPFPRAEAGANNTFSFNLLQTGSAKRELTLFVHVTKVDGKTAAVMILGGRLNAAGVADDDVPEHFFGREFTTAALEHSPVILATGARLHRQRSGPDARSP